MTTEHINSGTIVHRLLRLREASGPRADLRRGHSPNTDHYAYPYLASYWTEHGKWARVPLLRLSALVASNPQIVDDPEVKLGHHLAQSAVAGTSPGDERDRAMDRVGRRLVSVQHGNLEKLHTVLRQLLQRREAARPLSWRDVADTYLYWDQPDNEHRRRHRRQLLERFYSAQPAGFTARDATS